MAFWQSKYVIIIQEGGNFISDFSVGRSTKGNDAIMVVGHERLGVLSLASSATEELMCLRLLNMNQRQPLLFYLEY